jgi:predicted small secreted protein
MINRVFALGVLVLLTACNTIEGAGRDISSVGRAMTGAANEAKDD